jgi:thiamine-phosphate pyrophosphorylase
LPACGLYAITDGPRPDLLAAVEAALSGGAAILQYRDKSGDSERRQAEAADMLAACRRFGVPLIINDDVELAATIGADGVHLGEHDGDIDAARMRLRRRSSVPPATTRSIAPGNSPPRAPTIWRSARSSRRPPSRWRAAPSISARCECSAPLVAIGGITPDNAQPLIEAGADFVAAISGVFAASDPSAAARRYANLFTK